MLSTKVPQGTVHGTGQLAMSTAEPKRLDVLVFERGKDLGTVFGVLTDQSVAIVIDVRREDLERTFGSRSSLPAAAFEAVVGKDAQEQHDAVAISHAAVGDLVRARPAIHFADEVRYGHGQWVLIGLGIVGTRQAGQDGGLPFTHLCLQVRSHFGMIVDQVGRLFGILADVEQFLAGVALTIDHELVAIVEDRTRSCVVFLNDVRMAVVSEVSRGDSPAELDEWRRARLEFWVDVIRPILPRCSVSPEADRIRTLTQLPIQCGREADAIERTVW